MSVNYLAVLPERDALGVAVFHRGAVAAASNEAIGVARGAGRLAAAASVPLPRMPPRWWRRIGASVSAAMAVRVWFGRQPFVGGAGVPEEFIYSRGTRRGSAVFLGALGIAWQDRRYDEESLHLGPMGGFHVVEPPVVSWRDFVGGREEVEILSPLVRAGDDGALAAVAMGLRYLGRV